MHCKFSSLPSLKLSFWIWILFHPNKLKICIDILGVNNPSFIVHRMFANIYWTAHSIILLRENRMEASDFSPSFILQNLSSSYILLVIKFRQLFSQECIIYSLDFSPQLRIQIMYLINQYLYGVNLLTWKWNYQPLKLAWLACSSFEKLGKKYA